ncbi:MAG: hypothetical protein CMI14_02285 [Oleispira sp.]|nr:hypothetical protein [Oleispira sp.]
MNNNNLLDLSDIESWQQETSFGHDIKGVHRLVEDPKERVHFVHGNGFSAGTLIPLIHLMPKSWDCYISNVPGHGGSTWFENRIPNWLEMADALAESIRKKMDIEKKGPVVGIGHSFGGALTLIAASRNPDLFSRVILLDPVMIMPAMSVAQYFMRGTGLWKKTASYKSVHNRKFQWRDAAEMKAELSKKRLYRNFAPQVMEHFVDSASHINDQGLRELSCSPSWEASIFASFPRSLWKSVKKLSVRTDIVMAENTFFYVRNGVETAVKKNSNVHLHEFGNGHCFPMDQPIETAELIIKILGSPQ